MSSWCFVLAELLSDDLLLNELLLNELPLDELLLDELLLDELLLEELLFIDLLPDSYCPSSFGSLSSLQSYSLATFIHVTVPPSRDLIISLRSRVCESTCLLQ